MSSEEIKKFLTENTPLYDVLADLIVEYTQPIKFKVGDIIVGKYGQPIFIIEKRNKKSFRVREFSYNFKYEIDGKNCKILKNNKDGFYGVCVLFNADECDFCLDMHFDHDGPPLPSVKCGHGENHIFSRQETFAYIKDDNKLHIFDISKKTKNMKIKINEIGDEYVSFYTGKIIRKTPDDVFDIDKNKMIHIPEKMVRK